MILNLSSGGLPGPNLVRYNKDHEIVAPLFCMALATLGAWLWKTSRPLAILYVAAFVWMATAKGWLAFGRASRVRALSVTLSGWLISSSMIDCSARTTSSRGTSERLNCSARLKDFSFGWYRKTKLRGRPRPAALLRRLHGGAGLLRVSSRPPTAGAR